MDTATTHPGTRHVIPGDQVHIDIHLNDGFVIGKWNQRCITWYGSLPLLSEHADDSHIQLVYSADEPGMHSIDVEVTSRDGHLMRRTFKVICN